MVQSWAPNQGRVLRKEKKSYEGLDTNILMPFNHPLTSLTGEENMNKTLKA